MYEIKEEGFEHRGYKLGQITTCGKIIGFDIRKGISDFIAINNNIDEHKHTIMDSNYVDIILNGYENSCFSWHVEGGIILRNENKTNEIIPTMQAQLNIIQQIRKAINGHNVKLEFFQEEFCVSLYDSEIPICWDKQNGLYLLTETMSGNIYSDMVVEILDVIKIIESNLEWFTGCMQND